MKPLPRLHIDAIKQIPSHHLAWLWLLVGAALLPFTFWQTVIPLAAWLAPIFLLRFARTCNRPRLVLPLVFMAYAAGIFISLRGAGQGAPLFEYTLYVIQFPVVKGLLFALPYLVDRWTSRTLGPWGRTLAFPLAFTAVDWGMSRLTLIMNTGSPAYSQYGNLVLMQIISVTGMWGLTFLIMWFAATVNVLWECRFDWRAVRGELGLYSGALAAVLVFGALRLGLAAPASPVVKAATITLDASVRKAAGSSIDWATFNQSTDIQRAAARPNFQATVDQMLAQTETALRGGAKLVVWEEASALVLDEDKQSVVNRAAALAKQYDAYLQLGLWVSTRTSARTYTRNQAILIDNSGAVVWTYDKTHPVFLGEWYVMIPGSGRLPAAETPYGRMSSAICNDFHFQPLIRQAGQNGADIMLAPYADVIPFSHEDFVVAVYRAVENGFSMVRAAGNGVSAVIDYQGRVLGRRDYFADGSGVMLSTVPQHGVTTIYGRIGDSFAYLCVAGLAILSGWTWLRRRQPAPAPKRCAQAQPSEHLPSA